MEISGELPGDYIVAVQGFHKRAVIAVLSSTVIALLFVGALFISFAWLNPPKTAEKAGCACERSSGSCMCKMGKR